MPSLPRRDVIDESVVGTYHIWSRVAQREFLLGREPRSKEFNIEGGTTGTSFWAGRFGCSRLTTATSLLTCSIYVAMNQMRAGMARGVADSEDSSVHNRLQDRRSGDPGRPQSGWLAAVHVDGDGYGGALLGRRASDKGVLGGDVRRVPGGVGRGDSARAGVTGGPGGRARRSAAAGAAGAAG